MRISDWSSDVCSFDLRDGFILDSQQYANLDSGRFFMRVEFRGEGPRFPEGLTAVQDAFAPVVQRFAMDARISDRATKPRFVIAVRSEEHTSELQSLMRNSYAVFCLKKKTKIQKNMTHITYY